VVFEQILDPSSPFFWLCILVFLLVVFAVIGRYLRTYVKFIYPNAKFEAIGNPFILEKELNTLVETMNLDTFKDRLNVLRDYQVTGETASLIQQSLDQNFLQTITIMKQDSSKKLYPFYDLYLQRRDMYLIKNEVKKILSGIPHQPSQNTTMIPWTTEILTRLHSTTKETLPALLASAGFDKELLVALSKEPLDLLQIDILFDSHVLRQFKELKVPYKCDQAKHDYVKNLIDQLTIKYLLRAKHLSYPANTCITLYLGDGKQISQWRFKEMAEAPDVPQLITALDGTSYFSELSVYLDQYAKEKSVQVFEKGIDRVFLQRIKELSFQNYLTIGPSLRFLVSKEFEIKNLKVIAKGITENLSTELIKNNLIKEGAS
jgi:V/A-type H+-transporting ATPase subunit C